MNSAVPLRLTSPRPFWDTFISAFLPAFPDNLTFTF